MHDDEITPDEPDDHLDHAETLDAARPDAETEVRLYVAGDSETLHELECVCFRVPGALDAVIAERSSSRIAIPGVPTAVVLER